MQASKAPCLTSSVAAVILALCLSRGLGSAVDTAALDGISRHSGNPFVPLHRTARTTFEDVPCVSVPHLSALKQRFIRWLDHNNDGTSTFEEVKSFLQRLKSNVKDDVVEDFIRRRDQNGNGAIDFVPEYVHDSTVSDYTLEGATEAFHLQDTNQDEAVDEQEILNAGKALGMSSQEAEEMARGYYMEADANSDGKLSFDEYKTLYNQ